MITLPKIGLEALIRPEIWEGETGMLEPILRAAHSLSETLPNSPTPFIDLRSNISMQYSAHGPNLARHLPIFQARPVARQRLIRGRGGMGENKGPS